MGSDLTLSHDELVELTGYKMPSHQIRWLKDRRWRYELTRFGRPKVDRGYYRAKMGVAESYTPVGEPNWAAGL